MNKRPSINAEEQQELQKPFEEEEVMFGLKACATDKAPVRMDTLWVIL